MHEVSLARAIIGIVQEHINGTDPGQVTRIKVRAGKSAGVVAQSLQFAFQVLTAEGPLRRARLVIDEVPFRIHCFTCELDSENPEGLGICSRCGTTDVDILSGTELEVSSIETEETYEYHHD